MKNRKRLFCYLRNKFAVNTRSFKYRLIASFCTVSILPIVVMQISAYYNTRSIIQRNVDNLMAADLVQTQKSLEIRLSSYNDLLYQMYTDDDIVKLVDNINSDQEIEVSCNQLRRKLGGLANIKSYVQSATVITSNGTSVFYDKITASNIKNSWIGTMGNSAEQLFAKISSTNDVVILPTQIAMQKNYLFHLGHKIIDYTNVNKKNGVIILSIDEKALNEICNQNDNADRKQINFNFLVDGSGKLVSFADPSKIGTTVVNPAASIQEQNKEYQSFIKSNSSAGGYVTVHSVYDKDIGWYLVNVSDQSEVVRQTSDQLRITILVLILSIFALILIIIFISNRMTSSIAKVVNAMEIAGRGELTIRVNKDKRMPQEIVAIAEQFNKMIKNINNLIRQVKIATEKQKNAEIAALEAQINPHFLYNTLDTINWMAIDRDQYEISNTINSLAHILRYGIDRSNSIVEIRQEVDWLKEYIFLQQTRLKNSFECRMHVDASILGCHIHKLLFQPFVENAFIHGFHGVERKHILEITIGEESGYISIKIFDNGKGMSEDMIRGLSADGEDDEAHIGVRNAIGRLKMYYGDRCNYRIISQLGESTTVQIEIPKE